MSGKSFMNDGGESYCGVVSAKQPNKGGASPAEVVEKRPQTKENTQQPNLGRTQSRESKAKRAGACAGSSQEGWETKVHGSAAPREH